MPKSTIYIETVLPDVSGELLRFLKYISESKANIVEIVHIRERKHGNKIPVGIYLEIDDKSILPPLLKSLQDQGYTIERNQDLTALETKSFIIIGHVFETGITNLIDQIFAIDGATVKSVNARLTSAKDVSTVGLTIGTTDERIMSTVIKTLERVCDERELQLIKPLVIK
ncbi:MAG: hypothetical protein ACTSW4_04000 [Candidatus Ranarchaeia archaeon]